MPFAFFPVSIVIRMSVKLYIKSLQYQKEDFM